MSDDPVVALRVKLEECREAGMDFTTAWQIARKKALAGITSGPDRNTTAGALLGTRSVWRHAYEKTEPGQARFSLLAESDGFLQTAEDSL